MSELVIVEQPLEQDVEELYLETRHLRPCAASSSAVFLLQAAEQLLCLVLAPQSLRCTHCKWAAALKP